MRHSGEPVIQILQQILRHVEIFYASSDSAAVSVRQDRGELVPNLRRQRIESLAGEVERERAHQGQTDDTLGPTARGERRAPGVAPARRQVGPCKVPRPGRGWSPLPQENLEGGGVRQQWRPDGPYRIPVEGRPAKKGEVSQHLRDVPQFVLAGVQQRRVRQAARHVLVEVAQPVPPEQYLHQFGSKVVPADLRAREKVADRRQGVVDEIYPNDLGTDGWHLAERIVPQIDGRQAFATEQIGHRTKSIVGPLQGS
mmetsp:Transcript_23585/g.50465  ORF Transcript_23585/g.50465 Transcript_23585/m.50465 type:complete len:255 (-) Transcript_23585:843-1607(-)